MAVSKAWRKISMILLGLFLLSGCAGKPLIEREIVRAIFFSGSGGVTQATLLLQDQQQEAPDAYQMVNATGDTPAQAWSNAAQKLDGTAFYGVMDMVGLPQDTDYAELMQYTDLIHQTAQPSPEVLILLLDGNQAAKLPDEAGKLYDSIRNSEKRYGISCGLEDITAQKGTAALPLWQDATYGFAILTDEGTLCFRNAMSAQLAAVLCRQTDQLDLIFGEGDYTCQADASWVCRATPKAIQVHLQLRDAKLSALDPKFSGDDNDLQQILAEELEDSFLHLKAESDEKAVDPFRFQFWAKCLLGTDAAPLPVSLSVKYL